MTDPTPIKRGKFPEPVMSEEEREKVFQVWAMLADRKPTTTSQIAKRDFGLEVKPATISAWASRYNWTIRARQLYNDVAPGMMERARASLVGAVPGAAAYFLAVSQGREEANRDKTVAMLAVLDRTGFLPHTRREVEKGGTSPVNASHDGDPLELMSDEELKAIASGRLVDR